MFFKTNQTKEEIISLLSKKWPLTLTQIKERGNFSISYQYLRQCVNELTDEGIIHKRAKNYELNQTWLQTISKFSDRTLKDYKLGKSSTYFDKQTSQVQLNSLYEMGHFMLDALESRFLETHSKQGFHVHLSHLWIPFADKEKQNRLLKLREKENITLIFTKTTFLDKMLHTLAYKKYCTKVKRSTQLSDYDFFVYKNTLLQIYYPKKLKEKMNKLYSAKSNPFRKIADLFALTYQKFPITIIITRNKQVANQHRKKVIEQSQSF